MEDWLKLGGKEIEGNASGHPAPAKDAAIHSLRYVVLDTELTSLDHRTNRLLSVGAIAMQGPSIQLGEQFYRVVNPQVSIPPESVVIHRLRSQDVEAAEGPEKILGDLHSFIAGAVLVGHFVDIDLKILRKEMARTGHKLDNLAVDTARAHHWLLRQGPYSEDLPVQLEKLDLPTLAQHYRLEVQDVHHALADSFLTARVWQKMLHALQAKKVDTLRKLLRIAGA